MQITKVTKIVAIVIISIVLIIVLHYTGVLRPVENVLSAVLRPIQNKVFNLSGRINDFYYNQKSQKELAYENHKLKEELAAMQYTESRLKELEQQNEFLREQVSFFSERNINGIVANVIGRSQDSFQNFIILDKGEKQGIKEGYAVTIQDVVIGKIYDVSKYTSRVLLINDTFSKLAVSVQNKDYSIGILTGEYGLGLRIDLIPQNEKISEGDYVITSGLEENVPRGLYIGQIDNVIYTEGELFQTAFVKSPIDFNKINLVSILQVSYDSQNN